MEDFRDDLTVIVAGYPDEMASFIAMNAGLASRFGTFIEFEDYSAAELLSIFVHLAKASQYKVERAAMPHLLSHLTLIVAKRTKGFGNGRVARNLFERVVRSQAARLCTKWSPSRSELATITEVDVLLALRPG